MKTYTLNDFNYQLPKELIAQTPAFKRDESKLLIASQKKILQFRDIIDYFDEKDVLVINTSKVMKARLFGKSVRTGKTHELLFTEQLDKNLWHAMIFNTKQLSEGDKIELDTGKFAVLKQKKELINEIELEGIDDIFEIMETKGFVPLPPYIKRKNPVSEDKTRYQTVYAEKLGSAAAPTAGLHFTDEIIEKLKAKGVTFVPVILHVGPGTFLPVKTQNPDEHKMHSEYIELSEETASVLNNALKNKYRINAIGTTSLRVMESCFKNNSFFPYRGMTKIFIRPPFSVCSAERLLTNFHQPQSTLFMLVSAFSGLEFIQETYSYAIKSNMRFFSYGDAVLLENRKRVNLND